MTNLLGGQGSRGSAVVVICTQGAAKAYVQPTAMDSEDSDDDVQSEIDDEDVNKILIVTQTPPSKKKTGQNRTGMPSYSWLGKGGACSWSVFVWSYHLVLACLGMLLMRPSAFL